MGIAKELVDRQDQLLRQRNSTAVPELYTSDAVFLMPGLRVRPHELPGLMQALSGRLSRCRQPGHRLDRVAGRDRRRTDDHRHSQRHLGDAVRGVGCDREAGALGIGRDRPVREGKIAS